MSYLAGVVSIVAFAAAGLLLLVSSVLRELRAPGAGSGSAVVGDADQTSRVGRARRARRAGTGVTVLLGASVVVAATATAVRLLAAIS